MDFKPAIFDDTGGFFRQDIALGVAALEHPGWIVLHTRSLSQFHLPHGLEEGGEIRTGGETAQW